MNEQFINEPSRQDHSWQSQAECIGSDPELFYPERNRSLYRLQVMAAKAICADCPVRTECLDNAIEQSDVFGIWGGLTAEERDTVARRMLRTRRQN